MANRGVKRERAVFPVRVSVKVAHLRPRGFKDLADWLKDPSHKLVCRRGRVFINGRVFHYGPSEWANPSSTKEYGLDECLRKYRQFLDDLLANDATRARFLHNFEGCTEIGCFCEPGANCHGDEILRRLSILEN